jgi:membrane-bound lytic murein transglycosylase D
MIKNKSFTTLVASLLLVGCNALPIQSLNSEPKSVAIDTPSEEESSSIPEEPILSKSPSEELLAQELRKQFAQSTIIANTQSDDYWHLPLNLSRPDPYAKYNDDLYQVMRRGFTFDLTIDDTRIDQQLRWYASHQSYINRVSDRASRYMFHIVAEIEKRDMPMDLALLPIVESAFDPFAYSHGRASGMWQFIPSTGRMYDLKQNWWYDGRRDVVESTRAALDYLSQLNRMFDGDWLLALASYNSGPGTVLKAQKKNRAAGKPTDFWHLDLPKETEAYVPKMFALAKLFHSPDEYGIELPFVSTEPYFEIVETGGQIDLAQAAKLADMNLSDLYLLNPGFNRWATDPDGPHQLLVFYDKAELFAENIASLPADQRLTWKRYTIESGDSLLTIARKFEVTVDVVKDVNNIRGNLIRAGDKLLIPVASQNDQYYALSADNRLKVKQNALSGSDKKRIDYKVQSGDTFWDISRKFNVSVQSLAKWNNMAPKDVLKPNQNLVIWVDPSSTATTTASIDDRKVVRKVGYVVRSGDSLYRIADKFNLRVTDIEKWNTLPKKYLQPGDRLTLYVDVTRIQ